MFSDVDLHLTQPALPFIFGSLGSCSHSMSVLQGEEVDVRIKSGSDWTEVGRKGEKESGRGERGERGREEGEQEFTGQEFTGKALPHSGPNIPATECALSFLDPRILLILFFLPKAASFFPLNLLIPTFPSGEHCASNAKGRPRQAE